MSNDDYMDRKINNHKVKSYKLEEYLIFVSGISKYLGVSQSLVDSKNPDDG